MTNLRSSIARSFGTALMILLTMSVTGCPKKDEASSSTSSTSSSKKDKKDKKDKGKKDKKGDDDEKKGDDDDDDKKGSDKKSDDDDDDDKTAAKDPDAVCEHVQELVDADPDNDFASRVKDKAKCLKLFTGVEKKKGDKVLATCLACVDKAKDLKAMAKGCEEACGG